jgi:hypothetical protein
MAGDAEWGLVPTDGIERPAHPAWQPGIPGEALPGAGVTRAEGFAAMLVAFLCIGIYLHRNSLGHYQAVVLTLIALLSVVLLTLRRWTIL